MDSIHLPEIRLIPYSINTGAMNMAIDEYLISMSKPVLRFYGWQEPTLSFGRLNQGIDEIDQSYCKKQGLQSVKRLSGGKTILHQHEITYSFVADISDFPTSLLETYRLISHPLATCLASLGLKPEMKKMVKSRDQQQTTICFKEVSAYEVTIGGKKLIGSAQFRKRKRFLQHGSILLDIDWNLWKKVWKISDQSLELENRITSIRNELGSIPEKKHITDLLTREFTKFFQTSATNYNFSSSDLEEIRKLEGQYTQNI